MSMPCDSRLCSFSIALLSNFPSWCSVFLFINSISQWIDSFFVIDFSLQRWKDFICMRFSSYGMSWPMLEKGVELTLMSRAYPKQIRRMYLNLGRTMEANWM